MEKYTLHNNITVLCETATSFPNGYCLEMYINENDVRCMVRIKN